MAFETAAAILNEISLFPFAFFHFFIFAYILFARTLANVTRKGEKKMK